MYIRIDDHTLRYTVEQSILCYLGERPEYGDDDRVPDEASLTDCRCGSGDMEVTMTYNGRSGRGRARVSTAETDPGRARRQALGIAVYRAVCDLTGESYVWGALTGVRPARVADRILASGKTAAETAAVLRRRYGVSARRARLCVEAAGAARRVERELSPAMISLYIAIPFCRSRCSYCSFVSQSVEKDSRLLPLYLEALERELEALAEGLERSGAALYTLYIGGGTPTVLSAEQLEMLLLKIQNCWHPERLGEYTVEAGRPDTIDQEKLSVLTKFGVNRISVNPQSMDDTVLHTVGRLHTARQTIQAVEAARGFGLTVNMDLIAGLPGERPGGFVQSVETVLGLRPENITLHTLALKRGARLGQPDVCTDAACVLNDVDKAQDCLRKAGYRPYYLYRQKRMAAACENSGWCLPGYDSAYNIVMMEELHSVAAVGAGGVSKLCYPGGRIERVFNPKYPVEYMKEIERIIHRKRSMEWVFTHAEF